MKYSKDNRVALGNDLPRLDIVEKVTGRAKYTTDQYPDKMMFAAYIRCPYGNAKCTSVDLDAARNVKGVLDVEMPEKEGDYAGDRLGHICAESKAALEEAFAALKMKWDINRPKTRLDAEKAPMDKAEVERADEGKKALETGGAIVHEVTYETQVQTHTCLEPHIGVVDFRGDNAVAWGSTQGTFSFRDELTRPLGLKPDKIEFHCEYVGGGFGSKFGAGAEGDLAAQMSKKFGRPCRVGNNRKEEHLDAGNRPGSMQYMKVAADKDGKLLGGRIHTWGSVGPSGGGGKCSNPARYNFGAIAKSHAEVNLNGGEPRAFRAPGHPQGMFGVEMFMEEMAAKLGMDPLEFRVKNDPNETRHEMMKVGAEMIGWSRRVANGASKGAIKTGFGVAVADWGNGKGGGTIQLNIYRNGTVEILSGAQDIGTGYRTMLAECVASQLGISRKWITTKVGSSTYPPGPASGGSVTSRSVAPKAFAAAQKAKLAILDLVAKETKTDASKLKIAEDTIRDGSESMTWDKACKLIADDHLTVSAGDDGEFWKRPTGSEAVQFVELTVDTETGIVRVKKVVALQEVGLPTNRHTIENQITGGVIQGISFALFEERVLNKQTGAMCNPNMDQYKIAGPVDVPEVLPIIWRSREDSGVNSLGEPPTIPTPGAVGCAVFNAIGVPVRSMPITPAKILAALAGKDGQA